MRYAFNNYAFHAQCGDYKISLMRSCPCWSQLMICHQPQPGLLNQDNQVHLKICPASIATQVFSDYDLCFLLSTITSSINENQSAHIVRRSCCINQSFMVGFQDAGLILRKLFLFLKTEESRSGLFTQSYEQLRILEDTVCEWQTQKLFLPIKGQIFYLSFSKSYGKKNIPIFRSTH